MPATVPAALERAASQYPDASAIVDGAEVLTYGDLYAASQRAASAFVAAGFASGERVALWAPNSARWIVAMYGLLSAGAGLVPLNTRFRGGEAAYILRRSGARVLLTVRSFLGHDYTDMLAGEDPGALEAVVALDTAEWDAFLDKGRGSEADATRRAEEVTEADPMDLMFTSGTTGAPKGVSSTHGATIRAYSFYASTLGICSQDRYLLVNPLFHSFGCKAGAIAALLSGACIYPVAVFDAAAVSGTIDRDEITVLPGPPTLYQSLLDLPAESRPEKRSLRLAVTGAAAVPVSLLGRMREELGFETVLTAYGLTETGGLVSMCSPDDSTEVVSRTSGKPVPGMEVKVVGGEGETLPPGQAGEICVRGYSVMAGYYEDPDATREAIVDGWLHTGDIGVLDEAGYLQITDRKKDMFITGGFNVYPAEVEACLLHHPAVSRVAVVGEPDERLGEVGVAFVVPRQGEAVDPEALISWARERIANFKVPRRLVVVDELPVNASGKVQKHLLREKLTAGDPA